MMNISVVGCGYVGSAAADYWQKQGHRPTVTTTSSERLQALGLRFGKATLFAGQEDEWGPLLDQADVLLLSMAPANAADYERTYLKTAQGLKKALQGNSSLKQIIYTSSCSVYGSHEGKWVDENTPLLSSSTEAQILAQTEEIFLDLAAPHLKVTIFRLSEIYGPDREIYERLKRSQGKVLAGDGSFPANIIHLGDIVRALDYAIHNHLNGIYNLSSDFHLSRKEFYDLLCKAHNINPMTWDASKPVIHGGNRLISNRKIKQTGFTFLYPLYLSC